MFNLLSLIQLHVFAVLTCLMTFQQPRTHSSLHGDVHLVVFGVVIGDDCGDGACLHRLDGLAHEGALTAL